jgi:hypothetical protein
LDTPPPAPDAPPGQPRAVGLRGVLDERGRGLDGIGEGPGTQHPLRTEHLLGPPRQRVDIERPRRPVVGHHDLVEHRFQRRQDAGDVLVAQHADHTHQVPEVELGRQRRSQGGRPGRVVGRVDENRGGAAHPLQPARTVRRGEPGVRWPQGMIADVRAFAAAGVDGFFTDDPALGRVAVDHKDRQGGGDALRTFR